MSEFIYLKVPKKEYEHLKPYACMRSAGDCCVPCATCDDNLDKHQIPDPLEPIREVYEEEKKYDFAIMNINIDEKILNVHNEIILKFWKAIKKAVEGQIMYEVFYKLKGQG